MAKFEIYTYQFQRIKASPQGYLDLKDVPKSNCTDEQWEKRQELFGQLFNGNVKLEFKSNRAPLLHEIIYNENNIVVMYLANEKEKSINGKDFKPKYVKDYPWCYVIFDNRKDIQRMLVSVNKHAWPRTDMPARIIYRTFDEIMKKEGMHFNPGERPIYPKHEFWDVVENAHQGVNRVLFKFPPTNLGRLLNLADNIDAVRQETGGAVNVDMIAPKGGVLDLGKENTQTDAMVGLGAASGNEIKVWVKGVRTPQTIGKDSIVVEISDVVLSKLNNKDLFNQEFVDKLIVELNNIKTLYA